VLHADGDESAVAVVFPGASRAGGRIGGSPARPDLHYTRAVLRAEGLAVFEVWWDAGGLPQDDRERWLDENVDAALEAAASEGRVAFLAGRSLGTWALARVVARPEWRPVPTIWLAPLLHMPVVAEPLRRLRSPAFAICGGVDEAYDRDVADALEAEVVVLEGANHALEVDDPAESARLLAGGLERMRRFVAAYA
jgi:pimeloyl-ACP methyl ester carboxylesterase